MVTSGTISTFAFIVGGAALTGGAILYLSAPTSLRVVASGTSVHLVGAF
jgi:hypothetical protein